MKYLFIVLGFLSLSLGIVGIVLPGLPTTPFLLLSASLFMKGSHKLHRWLLSNRLFGKYIRKYRKNPGLTIKAKVSAISFMWIMILISCWFAGSWVFRGGLIFLGTVGVAVMGFFIKTIKDE